MTNTIVSHIRQLSVALVLLPLASLQFCADGAGRIVVANDDWTLSDGAWSAESARFSTNIVAWFTHGRPGRFLGYLADGSHSFYMLENAITNAGHSWVLDTSEPLTISNLLAFDGVFLGDPVATNSVLIEYVNAGGNVYLYGHGYMDEPANWNTFLSAFGLSFTNVTTCCFGGTWVTITNAAHPIFAGVTSLYQDVGEAIVDIAPADLRGQVVMSDDEGRGLYAVWDSEFGLPYLDIEFYAGITMHGVVGTTNRIEYVTSVGDTNWTTLTNIVLPQTPYLIFDPDSPRWAHRFYRAVQLR